MSLNQIRGGEEVYQAFIRLLITRKLMCQVGICCRGKEVYAREGACKIADRYQTRMHNPTLMEPQFKTHIMMRNQKENKILAKPSKAI